MNLSEKVADAALAARAASEAIEQHNKMGQQLLADYFHAKVRHEELLKIKEEMDEVAPPPTT